MPNEIDELMDRDPLDLSSQDIDKIIAYMRNQLMNFTAGGKPQKDEGPKLDLSQLGLVPKAEPIKRRV